MAEKVLSFEDNLKNLEKIIEQLEKGECSLEESINLFESGVKYTNECRKALENAQQKIITLTELEEGEEKVD